MLFSLFREMPVIAGFGDGRAKNTYPAHDNNRPVLVEHFSRATTTTGMAVSFYNDYNKNKQSSYLCSTLIILATITASIQVHITD